MSAPHEAGLEHYAHDVLADLKTALREWAEDVPACIEAVIQCVESGNEIGALRRMHELRIDLAELSVRVDVAVVHTAAQARRESGDGGS